MHSPKARSNLTSGGEFVRLRYKEEMNAAKLVDTNLLIFGAPREKFSMAEVRVEASAARQHDSAHLSD